MAAQNPLNVLYNPGTLVKDPTNFAAAYPYGGTILGTCRDVIFRPNIVVRERGTEEYGEQVTGLLYVGERSLLTAVLIDYDIAMIQTAFRGTSTGTSGKAVINYVPSTHFGANLPTIKLLFAPFDATRNPAIYMKDAQPLPQLTEEYQLAMDKEFGIPVAFRCGILGYKMGILTDLTA